ALPTLPCERIGGEENAGHLCFHHPLYYDSETYVLGCNVQIGAVLRCAISPQRSKTMLDGSEHRLDADHIEKGLLLPGKGGFRQVFGSRRGTDGDRYWLSRRKGPVG